MTIKVTVIWDDDKDSAGKRDSVNAQLQLYSKASRSSSSLLRLTGDTAVEAPKAVSTDDGMTYVWENVPVLDNNGNRLTYMVDETLSLYSKAGDENEYLAAPDAVIEIEITNSYDPDGSTTDDTEGSPSTGDDPYITFYVVAMCLSISGIVFHIREKRRKRA